MFRVVEKGRYLRYILPICIFLSCSAVWKEELYETAPSGERVAGGHWRDEGYKSSLEDDCQLSSDLLAKFLLE